MIQLTLKTIDDFENQGPILDIQLHHNGNRIRNTAISMTGTSLTEYAPEDLLWAALKRLDAEEEIPF